MPFEKNCRLHTTLIAHVDSHYSDTAGLYMTGDVERRQGCHKHWRFSR